MSRAAADVAMSPVAAAAAPTAAATAPPGSVTMLEGIGLQKRFGGITAITALDIQLPSGRITGLVGPNGAGKTTAFNVLTGFLRADEGEIRYKGKACCATLRPHQLVRAGIARSFQDLRLFTGMSVLENVLVALPRQSRRQFVDAVPAAVSGAPRRMRRMPRKAMAILDLHRLAGACVRPGGRPVLCRGKAAGRRPVIGD